jgi:creatinine amidohydrolase
MTQRSEEEIDLLLKGPDRGGRHIYTIAWPS